MKLSWRNFGCERKRLLRQVCGYWEMVAAFIVHGTLNADLAYDTLGEMYFVYAILQPVVEEFRKKFGCARVLQERAAGGRGDAEGPRAGDASAAAACRDG